MELYQIRYFLALARSLNFTRAAEQCNVTQPALTKAIQKLEVELGGALVFRERNLTQLTQLGQLVLPMFERTLSAAEMAMVQATEYREKQIAPLRIGLGPGVSANIAVAPLLEVAKTVPGLTIELVDVPYDKASKSLLEGYVDALIAGDTDSETCNRFDRWHLFDECFVVVLPYDHPLVVYDTIPRAQLSDAIWLGFAGFDARQTAWERWRGSDAKCAASHRALQPFQLLPLVAAGMGLMLAPQHTPLIDGVVARFVDDPDLRRRVSLIAVAGRQHPPSLRALIKSVRAHDWSCDLDARRKAVRAVRQDVACAA